jgi:dTDP-4-dehydrorhamnose reductase
MGENTEQKTILVTGAGGQLGKELQKIAPSFPGYHFLFTRSDLPIEDPEVVRNYFEEQQIDVCINCAAYTAVDKAESEPELACMVNAEGVSNLARICAQHKAVFIHISTDYVFDGSSDTPYTEQHSISPVNIYGASKLKGEDLALHIYPASIIIRTSWLYSSFGFNFVKTMIRLMSERQSLNVVDDQFGCPTYAADLAEVIMKIIAKPEFPGGIVNYANEGVTNWYQFALEIKERAGKSCSINPVPSTKYPTAAKRPGYSVLDTTKIRGLLDLNIPNWKESLHKCLAVILTA